MPVQPGRSAALIWFSVTTIIIIGLVGAVTLTANQPIPSATPLPTFTFTPSPGTTTPSRPTRTHTPRQGDSRRGTLTASPTFTVSPTQSPTPAYLQCAWQWAQHPLREITDLAQAFFTESDFNVQVWADAYGENCIDYRPGTPTVAYFAAMTTDFNVTINSPNLTNASVLADSYVKAYELLVEFSAEADLPARPGYLTVMFFTPGYFTTVSAMFSEVEAFLDDGLAGQALLEALGGWPVTPMPQPT